MDWLDNVIFENREIQNERLELTDKNSLYYLSTGLTLRNCTVVLKVPASRLVINQARFIDCTFEVKQQLTNYQQWICASFKGCRFKGRFLGNDFGHWPEYSSAPGYDYGSIEDCDFSEARLDACRILGSDPRTLKFPRWPCFTILDPVKRGRELMSVEWPGRFRPVILEGPYQEVPRTTALTFYAPSDAKRCKVTEEDLKAAIQRFDFIVY
jgi:hypothetical protein